MTAFLIFPVSHLYLQNAFLKIVQKVINFPSPNNKID